MPAFLTDENLPIYPETSDYIDLEGSRGFDNITKDNMVNGGTIHQVSTSPLRETYESSNSSTHDSDTSDAVPMTGKDDITRQSSTISVTDGRRQDSGDGQHLNNSQNSKVFLNGVNLPVRTSAIATKEENQDASSRPSAAKGASFPSLVSVPPPSRMPPAEPSNAMQDSHGYAPSLSVIASEVEPQSAYANQASTMSLGDSPHRPSPHRYSSPPVYQAGAAGTAAGTTPSSSGHLQPPPAGAALRQRHTLEVPKLPPGRMSRDGLDSGQSTGRYSPTTGSVPRRASMSLARRGKPMYEMPRDEIATDEDTIRWQATVRQKRASKRRRRAEEDDDRVLVGTKVDESHANWVTAYNMLTGIRVSVSRTNAKLDRELTDADFQAKQKSTFDVAGNELVPSAKYDFKFKDYAPWVFRRLRTLFRLDPADYLISLTGKYILSELGSPGKSGSFFYFSRDYKYIIKTIHHSEHKFLRKILKDYYQHVTNNPNTLLSQFYGLHRVKTPFGKKIHFVVMNNLFPPHRDIHTTFDLKGSTIGRDYREEELAKNPRATLKDLNWLRRQRNLELGVQKKHLFLEQLRKDVVLLKRLQIMDYSLLIGIHDVSRGNEENLRDKTLQVFNPGSEQPPEEQQTLARTPSKLENARKTRELRQMLRSERPVPIGQAADRMQDVLADSYARPGFVFNQDDGGFRATHEDNEPADEIYYLGVIDCLTHYGIIKKIEHFWKGLSSDKTQISALPPQQYGDRFYNFVEGVTMSPEAAQLEAQRKEEEAVRASADRTSGHQPRKPPREIPAMPDHAPPAPPGVSATIAGQDTVEKANKQAKKTERKGASEKEVPDRTLRTVRSDESAGELATEPVLPIVEEAGENGRGQSSRPETPAKDKRFVAPTRTAPATPPKPSHRMLKPESADSGYHGESGFLRADSSPHKLRHRVSREDLDKSLPALPRQSEHEDSGVQMTA